MIFEDLEAVYRDGSDLERRGNMALASYWAGLAFTRALVGYVHAVAHNLGGMYGVPHGLANAIVLPHVLDFSRADCEEKLARLAIVGGIGEEGEAPAELAHRELAGGALPSLRSLPMADHALRSAPRQPTPCKL